MVIILVGGCGWKKSVLEVGLRFSRGQGVGSDNQSVFTNQ